MRKLHRMREQLFHPAFWSSSPCRLPPQPPPLSLLSPTNAVFPPLVPDFPLPSPFFLFRPRSAPALFRALSEFSFKSLKVGGNRSTASRSTEGQRQTLRQTRLKHVFQNIFPKRQRNDQTEISKQNLPNERNKTGRNQSERTPTEHKPKQTKKRENPKNKNQRKV